MRLFIALCLLTTLFSCNESKEITPSVLGYDYFPIQIGDYRVYDVEEIEYKLIGFDTSLYQLRETIFDSIQSDDQVSYLMRREKRETSTDPWVSDSVWVAIQTPNYIAINENNVPFMKLTFPVEVGREWDGNSLNSKQSITYYYQSVDQTFIDSVSIDNHIRLIIEDIPQNIVNQDERSEVYVRGVGLVQKDYLTLQFCTANCETLGEIQGGRYLNQTLIEYGRNE